MKLAVLSAEGTLVQCESGEDLKMSSNSCQRVTGQLMVIPGLAMHTDGGEVCRHERARPPDSV